MKGVILAGGSGSRLGHLTKITNKHLLPVGKYPMIYHPVKKLARADITDILVVTGCEHIGSIVGYLGSGREFGCDITYRIQDKPGGIAEALYLAKAFAGNENICVILGDNMFSESLIQHTAAFEAGRNESDAGAMVLLYGLIFGNSAKTRFGVAYLNSGHKIETIVEKPSEEALVKAGEKYRTGIVTGIYFYDNTVFDKIERIEYSARGEKEISDVNNLYISEGKLRGVELYGNWTDAGTFSSLRRANEMFGDED